MSTAVFTECVRVAVSGLTPEQVGELRRWDEAPEAPFVGGMSGAGKWVAFCRPEDAGAVTRKLESMGVACENAVDLHEARRSVLRMFINTAGHPQARAWALEAAGRGWDAAVAVAAELERSNQRMLPLNEQPDSFKEYLDLFVDVASDFNVKPKTRPLVVGQAVRDRWGEEEVLVGARAHGYEEVRFVSDESFSL